MSDSNKHPIVISLGGSLMVPDEIDTSFIQSFVDFIRDQVEQGRRFIIIAGGGKTARRYMSAVSELGLSHEETDWAGIYSTRLNGEMMRLLFKDLAYSEIVTDPVAATDWNTPVMIGAGWKPGRSSDYDAVEIGHAFGAETIVNFSNIEYVYDKDPKEYDDAEKIEEIAWDEYLKLIPEKWVSGMNTPFDPVASREAKKQNISVVILSGKMDNFRNYLENKPFIGTVIS